MLLTCCLCLCPPIFLIMFLSFSIPIFAAFCWLPRQGGPAICCFPQSQDGDTLSLIDTLVFSSSEVTRTYELTRDYMITSCHTMVHVSYSSCRHLRASTGGLWGCLELIERLEAHFNRFCYKVGLYFSVQNN